MKFIKDPKIIMIVVLIITIICGSVFTQYKKTQIETQYTTEIHTLDSLYKVDSLAMYQKYNTLDSSYKSFKSSKDSSSEINSSSYSNTKTLVRIIYKDSIVEKYIENTEYVRFTEKIITSLRDSLTESKKNTTALENQLVDLQTELSVKKTDSIFVVKTKEIYIEPIAKKFTVYGNVYGKSSQTINLGIGAEIGADYKIYSPIYIGASIRKDGIDKTNGYNAVARIGAKFDF